MSGRRRRRSKLPTEPVELSLHGLSHEGRGVSRIEGKVAFVDGGLAGERVRASYVSSRGQFDELRCIEVLEPSAERVEPPCNFAGICGGCSLQHMEPMAQILFKESVLIEKMTHSTGLDASNFEVLPAITNNSFGYRRKARLACRHVLKKGGMLVGFREKYSSFIADMNDCSVLTTVVARLIAPLREELDKLTTKTAIPQIEVAVGEREPLADPDHIQNLTVALIFRHLSPLPSADEALLVDFAKRFELELYFQPAGVASVHRVYSPDGKAEEQERLFYFLPEFGLKLAFHPTDFTQVNAGINRKIVRLACDLLQLEQGDRVLDLFCGLGNFTLPMATLAERVVGVEGSTAMVDRGYENAGINGIHNASFYAEDLTRPAPKSEWIGQAYDKILLDPPRSGALEIIPLIANFRAKKIVYISCNPATLARDAGVLLKSGYRLGKIGVMDMFPHTSHVESIAEFELK